MNKEIKHFLHVRNNTETTFVLVEYAEWPKNSKPKGLVIPGWSDYYNDEIY